METITPEKPAPTRLLYVQVPPVIRPQIERALLWNVAGTLTSLFVVISIRMALHQLPLSLRLVTDILRATLQLVVEDAAGFIMALLLLRSRTIGARTPFYVAAFFAGAAGIFSIFIGIRVGELMMYNGPDFIRFRFWTVRTATGLVVVFILSLALLGIGILAAKRSKKPSPKEAVVS